MRMSVSIALLVALAAPLSGFGDFFGHSQTLRAQFDEADVVATARAGEVKEHGASAVIWGYRQFEILQTIKGAEHQVGKEVVIDCPPSIKPGDLFLIVGQNQETGSTSKPRFLFSTFIRAEDQMIDYIVDAPHSSSSEVVKLAYYLPLLVSDNEDIRGKAYHICKDMNLQNLVSARDSIPVEAIRSAMRESEHVISLQEDFYGLLLGIAGNSEDERLLIDVISHRLERKSFVNSSQSLTGLILLSGLEGVEWIDENCLSRQIPLPTPKPSNTSNQNFKISLSGQKAILNIWRLKQNSEHTPNISEKRLSQSMQILLDEPMIADIAIASLTYFGEWSLMDKLYALYDAEGYDIPSVKRTIIRYYSAAITAHENKPTDDQRAVAEKYLAKLKKDDPKTYERAKKFLFLN